MRPHIPLARLALAAAASIAGCLPAQAASDSLAYRYSQTGFADGASISGWFIGQDSDDDGTLLAFELSGFSFSFSGNRAVPAFTLGMAHRAGLVFNIASLDLQHLAVVGPDDSRALEYDAFGWPGYHIPGRVSNNLDGLVSVSWNRLTVAVMAPVPEPQAAALWLAGLLALGALARRRRPAAGPHQPA